MLVPKHRSIAYPQDKLKLVPRERWWILAPTELLRCPLVAYSAKNTNNDAMKLLLGQTDIRYLTRMTITGTLELSFSIKDIHHEPWEFVNFVDWWCKFAEKSVWKLLLQSWLAPWISLDWLPMLRSSRLTTQGYMRLFHQSCSRYLCTTPVR